MNDQPVPPTDGTPAEMGAQTGKGVIEEHLGLVLSAIVALLTALKVLAVSHGDGTTVAAVLSTQGWAILPSVMLTMLPLAAVAPVFMFGSMLAEAIRERDAIGRLPWLLAGATAIAATVGSWTWLVSALAIIGFMIGSSVVWRLCRPGHAGRPIPANVRLAAALVITLTVLGAAATPRPWMPLEQVTGGPEPIVGYVLGSEDGQLIVLVDDTRTVVLVPSEDVASRELCESGSPTRSLLAMAFWKPDPDYLDCDVNPD